MAGFGRPGRRRHARDQRQRLLIVCEGERAECDYLSFLCRAEGQTAAHIVGGAGDPLGVVEEAIRRRTQAMLAARRLHEADQRYDQVWAVVDVDDHQRLEAARRLAAKAEIEIAVSNPCFELWLWLHFADADAGHQTDALRRGLEAWLPHYRERKRFDQSAFQRVLYPAIPSAIERAERLSRLRGVGTPGPFTEVARLVRVLRGAPTS